MRILAFLSLFGNFKLCSNVCSSLLLPTGFTKWSSTREPEQVFELLEALYGAFDKIALRRVVFKVETIGDCYMAVTGIPNAQPDHGKRCLDILSKDSGGFCDTNTVLFC